MSWTCDECGSENKPTFKFCFGCGSPKPGSPALVGAKESPSVPAPAVDLVEVPKETGSSTPKAAQKPVRASDRESGWRCHECWKSNSETSTSCGECGTARRASERAYMRDRVFGIFGAVGKWPIVLLLLAAIGAGLIGLFIYLNPKHGESILAPAGLEAEIRANLDRLSTRQIEDSAYFNCYSTSFAGRTEPGGYAAIVTLVPRATNVTNANIAIGPDSDRYWRFIAHREGYGWRVEGFRVADVGSIPDPCTVK